MSSLEIAELTNKPHCNVLKAIRAMEWSWEKVRGGKFPLTFRITELPNEVTLPGYTLTLNN